MITLATLEGGTFSGFRSWPSPCLHKLGRQDSCEQGRGKGKIITSWEAWVWTTHQASQGCGHFSRELVRGAMSQNIPPGQALSFDAWYPSYLLLKALHISTVWLIFHMNCYKRMQHWHGGAGGLCCWATTDSFCSQSPVAGPVVESQTGRCKWWGSLEPGWLFLSWEVSQHLSGSIHDFN